MGYRYRFSRGEFRVSYGLRVGCVFRFYYRRVVRRFDRRVGYGFGCGGFSGGRDSFSF